MADLTLLTNQATSIAVAECLPTDIPATAELGCVKNAHIFQHPLVEDQPRLVDAKARKEQYFMICQAETVCLSCPVFDQCLYQSVAIAEVYGYAAATSQIQRRKIRKLLGLKTPAEDLDQFIGDTRPGRYLPDGEVIHTKKTNPTDSNSAIALRLGCSLSTVKRHIKKVASPTNSLVGDSGKQLDVTIDQVKQAYQQVMASKLHTVTQLYPQNLVDDKAWDDSVERQAPTGQMTANIPDLNAWRQKRSSLDTRDRKHTGVSETNLAKPHHLVKILVS